MKTLIFLKAVQLFPILLIGFVLPWLGRTHRGLLFGVTVPLEFADSSAAIDAMRRYRTRTMLVAIVVTLAAVVTLGRGRHMQAVAPVAVIVELISAMVCWQRERRQILVHGIAVDLERSAELEPDRHIGAMLAAAFALLPLAAVGLWLQTHWSQIPDRWPQHWDAAGQANGWGVHTPVGVYLPLVMGAFVTGIFVAMVLFMASASGTQGRERGRILAPMAGLAWAISLFFCTIALLPLLRLTSVGPLVVMIVLHMVLIFGIVVWMVRRGGFMAGGAPAKTAGEAYDGTPDSHWYGGIFYYTPDDAAVMVAKRYGWGWTLNFARPAAWVFTGAILGFAVLSIWLPKVLR